MGTAARADAAQEDAVISSAAKVATATANPMDAVKPETMARIQQVAAAGLAVATAVAIFVQDPGPDPVLRWLPLAIAAAVGALAVLVLHKAGKSRPQAVWSLVLLRIGLLALASAVELHWGARLPALALLYPGIALLGFWHDRAGVVATMSLLAGLGHGLTRRLQAGADPAALTEAALAAGFVAAVSLAAGFGLYAWLRAVREEARLKAQRAAALGRLAETGTLAAMAAHEIRGPLTSVKGFLQMLQRRLHGHDDAKWVELIRRDIERVERLVRELLILGTPREPRQVLTPLLPLIEESVRAALLPDPASELLDVTIDCTADAEWPLDREQMRQVLVNLIRNAAEAALPHGQIKISATIEDGVLALSVRDSGCGIPAEQLDQVLEPFFTTKRTGTGLGLAICQRLVSNHGGSLSVDSTVGEGSVFTIRLGDAVALPPEVPQPASAEESRRLLARPAYRRSAALAAQRLRRMDQSPEKTGPRPAMPPAPAPRVQEGPR